jgi:hypothetical protein
MLRRVALLSTVVSGEHSTHLFLSTWRWRRYGPPKLHFLQEPHGLTFQKMPFVTTIVFRPNINYTLYNMYNRLLCNKVREQKISWVMELFFTSVSSSQWINCSSWCVPCKELLVTLSLCVISMLLSSQGQLALSHRREKITFLCVALFTFL